MERSPDQCARIVTGNSYCASTSSSAVHAVSTETNDGDLGNFGWSVNHRFRDFRCDSVRWFRFKFESNRYSLTPYGGRHADSGFSRERQPDAFGAACRADANKAEHSSPNSESNACDFSPNTDASSGRGRSTAAHGNSYGRNQ
jgi:hypothetical protein